MAVVSEGIQASQSILDFVGQIHERFTASDHYKSNAAVLQAKLDLLKQDDSIQLLPDSGPTRQTLRKTESALKTAQARLSSWEELVDSSQSCLRCIWWLWVKLAFALCPLQNALKEVDEDLKSIPEIRDEENKSVYGRRKANMSTRVHDNNKYIPIEESQREVIKAIEDTKGPPLILLHGGVGKGKSTLARYMCKRYGKSGEMSNVFDHVIVVSCGNSSMSDSATTKQYEILNKSSVSSLTDVSISKSEHKKFGKTSDAKSRIEETYEKLFLHKKILMVLDDVSDLEFLAKMWMAARDGKDDKILITSQKSNLCDAFGEDFVAIRMKNPSAEEARRILASLVGLENNTIPRPLLVIVNKMITATDGNPLALSCVATAFSYGQDKKGRSEWLDAWNELSTQLGTIEKSFVLAQNDGIAPPRSLWSAMKLCIDSLETRDANRILLLTYACEGGVAPEGVLRIVCAGLQMSSSAFNKSRDELVMKELLKHPADTLTSKTNLGKELNKRELQESPTWSLQSLVKLYMERNGVGKPQMASVILAALASDLQFAPKSSINNKHDCGSEIVEIDTEQVQMKTNIVESDDETRVRIALCALYFDRNHTDQGVTRAVIEACKRSNIDSEDTANKLRRKAIEPLLWLLDKREEQFGEGSDEKLEEGAGQDSNEELGEQWSKENKCFVRKVLLQYICKRQLDAENISSLLKLVACPSAQLAILKALTHISSIEETPLLNENTISFLPAILDLLNLKEGFHKSVQEAASETLSNICWKAAYDKSALLLANLPGVLDVLMQSLDCDSSMVSQNAASSLRGLAFSDEVAVQQEITFKEGILASLSNCLYDQSKPGLQISAAGALANLAFGQDDSLKLRITSEEGPLVGLVHCLSKHDTDDLRELAAGALANLAATKDDSLKLRIASEEGALVGLGYCLSQHDNNDLREVAALALANLAATKDDSLKLRIVTEEGALVGLVNCWSQSDYRGVQAQAARAVLLLSRSPDARLILRGTEGLVQGLTSLVGADVHADTRKFAVRALFNLDMARAQEMGLLSAKLDVSTLSRRIFIKAKLGDLEGALDDANEAVERSDTETDGMKAFILQERGVLKRMMRDWEGALADLDEGLKLRANDYEMLKHRGYVKFLLNDVEGARADAEWALSRESSRSDSGDYLGETAVEYLGYKL